MLLWLCLVAAGDRYVIDASVGRFTAKVGTGGLLSSFGHPHTVALRDYSGEADLPEGRLEGATLRLGIRADSAAEIGDAFSKAEREQIDRDVHAKVLEATKHPRIDFQGTAVSAKPLGEEKYQVQIDGQLTLHGVTRPLSIQAVVRVRDGLLTARGQFSIKHGDYGLERLSAAAGLVKASDEIVLSFDLQGRFLKH
ncbi:MAG TPA: YceI family protein [Planctomycetota bacterium]